ncbi:hypothetical protein evm_010596 [Chilo suppressalis]|nr:hypothetical protein evm_010596 [Chilo suppressalis]
MFERFLEIAFEAELNTEEDPELEQLACEQCNEDRATRDAVVAELRSMIYERGECQPVRMDDAFLLRYLRASKFIVPKAHRMDGKQAFVPPVVKVYHSQKTLAIPKLSITPLPTLTQSPTPWSPGTLLIDRNTTPPKGSVIYCGLL